MAITKDDIKKSVEGRKDLVVCDIQHRNSGTVDKDGLPIFNIVYEKAPTNYQLIRTFEHLKCVILKDLDYKENEEQENTD